MKCVGCKERKPDAHRRRQYTAYVEEEQNWKVLCDDCQEENDEYWHEQWQEYYNLIRG